MEKNVQYEILKDANKNFCFSYLCISFFFVWEKFKVSSISHRCADTLAVEDHLKCYGNESELPFEWIAVKVYYRCLLCKIFVFEHYHNRKGVIGSSQIPSNPTKEVRTIVVHSKLMAHFGSMLKNFSKTRKHETIGQVY